MSRWVSLNQARAKASLNASWSLRNFSEISRNSGSIFSAMSAVVIIVGTRFDGSCAAGAMSSSLLVDRLPLLRARGRPHQLIFIVEQQPEIILRPLGRRVHPRPFDAAGDGVLADAAFEACSTSRGPAARCPRPRAQHRPGSGRPRHAPCRRCGRRRSARRSPHGSSPCARR